MADLLTIGASSLLNLQQALNTTGHNIANVNTVGYSRQTVNFATRDAQNFGLCAVGQGAAISGVTRAGNAFITSQVQSFTSSQSRFATQEGLLGRMEAVLADADNGLSSSLQRFFNAVQEVATSPASLPERQVLLAEAQNLVSRQQNLQQMFNDLNTEVNSELRTAVSDINRLVDNIASLSREIVSAQSAAGGAVPNDLLDRRDLLVRDLAERVGLTVVPQDDGALNIFVGRGQALIVGSEVRHLQTSANPYASDQLEVGIAGEASGSNSAQVLGGGQLQGLLDFRSANLAPAQAQAGLVMLALTAAFNEQHGQGLDLNGESGANVFAPTQLTAVAHAGNTGAAVPVVTIIAASALRAGDYLLSYQGPEWTLTRRSDNTAVTGPGPLVLDGLSVDVSGGTPASGDSFLLNPGRDAAAGFALVLQDARKFAAAAAPADSGGARGDNGNALKLAALQQQALVNDGTDTLQQYYAGLVAETGIHSRQATANLEVETALLEQAVAYRDGVSGVNLDEEASNMLRYQQSYQAAAQVMKMADELFQVLLDSIR